MSGYETRCIGTTRLCGDDGKVLNPSPDYPDSYFCTGVRFVGIGVYVRCDNPRHTMVLAKIPTAGIVGAAHGYAAGGVVQYVQSGLCPHCGHPL